MRKATATGLLLFFVFNLNVRAIVSRDSRIIELTAASLGLSHTATLDRFPEMRGSPGVLEVDGHLVPLYPLVPALVAAPAFALAAATGILDWTHPAPETLDAIAKLTASALTAAACAMLYLVVRDWVPEAPAALVVIAAALSTPFWSTASQSLWGHATAACGLAMALRTSGRMHLARHAAIAAGLGLAVAVATRPLLAPFAAGFLVFARRSPFRAWFVGAMAGFFASVALWNATLIGHALGGATVLESPAVHAQVHLVESAWTWNFFDGGRAILFSPNRGVVVFMPLACWAIAGGVRLWNTSSEARLTLVAPTALYMVGWSAYAVWWGGHSYGPRYATEVVLPLTIMVATALFNGRQPTSTWSRRAAVVALIWGIGVQGIGAFCYPRGNWNDLPVDVDTAHARLWDWTDLEIVRTAAAGPHTQQLARLTRLLPSRATHAAAVSR